MPRVPPLERRWCDDQAGPGAGRHLEIDRREAHVGRGLSSRHEEYAHGGVPEHMQKCQPGAVLDKYASNHESDATQR